jgi:acyl-CoA reductase-like NAD-dependent aldehyde dehydrogenase
LPSASPGAYVFCRDLERAHRLAERLDTGMVWILYYAASTFGSSRSAILLATSTSGAAGRG